MVSGEVTLKGLLTAVDWHEDGSPSRLALLTPDEREYEVETDEVSRSLVRHLRGEVVIRGKLRSEGKRQVVRIASFRAAPTGFDGEE
jgi:hypothetical protein